MKRMGYVPVTCPPLPTLEDGFYANARTVAAAALDLVRGGPQGWLPKERAELKQIDFKGPF